MIPQKQKSLLKWQAQKNRLERVGYSSLVSIAQILAFVNATVGPTRVI